MSLKKVDTKTFGSGGLKQVEREQPEGSTSDAISKKIEKPFPKLRVAGDRHRPPLV